MAIHDGVTTYLATAEKCRLFHEERGMRWPYDKKTGAYITPSRNR